MDAVSRGGWISEIKKSSNAAFLSHTTNLVKINHDF